MTSSPRPSPTNFCPLFKCGNFHPLTYNPSSTKEEESAQEESPTPHTTTTTHTTTHTLTQPPNRIRKPRTPNTKKPMSVIGSISGEIILINRLSWMMGYI